MNLASSLPGHALAVLGEALDAHAPDEPPRVRLQILRICAESVAFAVETDPRGPVAPVTMRARSSARLLLELTCPWLDEDALTGLSVACERAALRRGRG